MRVIVAGKRPKVRMETLDNAWRMMKLMGGRSVVAFEADTVPYSWLRTMSIGAPTPLGGEEVGVRLKANNLDSLI